MEAYMNQLIVQAIEEKRLIELTYKGYSRIVEPHAYYRTINGFEKLQCYQVKGDHSSRDRRPDDDWGYFSVPKISSLSLLEKTFSGPRPDYKRPDKTNPTVYAQL
jgi:hypothetical protein